MLTQERENSDNSASQTEGADPIYNKDISIDNDQFQNGIKEYIKLLQEQNRMNLATALAEANHILDHNKWTCNANNELQKKLIDQNKDILPYLRKELNTPELYLELSISEKPHKPTDNQPYTPEEKLKAMMEKNPTLKRLQKLFNTRIIYK